MPSRRFARLRTTRDYRLKTIIVCEGITEFNYFQAIRHIKRVPAGLLRIVDPGASDPESLVRYAISERQEYIVERSWTDDDQSWAVFDGDEHIENNPQNWHRAIDLARRKGINLAISNPSFELWFLLHFQNQNASINRANVSSRLRTHLPGYEKGNCYFPEPLRALLPSASERATQLAAILAANGQDINGNPSTTVYSLVTRLNDKYVDPE